MAREHLTASHADREDAVDVLKAAFVQGRLTEDEFQARVGQAFASRTCADLAAITADIPDGAAQPRDKPAQMPGRVVAWGTGVIIGAAAFGGRCSSAVPHGFSGRSPWPGSCSSP